MCLDVILSADTCSESLFGLFLGMPWFLSGEHFLSPADEQHAWISIIPAAENNRQKKIPWSGDESASCLSVFLEGREGRAGKKQSDGWLAVSFQLTLPGPEELWPNLCFKETTNKCKQSVSKAGVQLLVSWSPLHCNVCLSILVTAERSCQLRWPVQIAISKEGEVHVCTSFYS